MIAHLPEQHPHDQRPPGLRTAGALPQHPALADIQRELGHLQAYFERPASLQRGAELAAALRLGIPHLERLLPHYTATITEAADALEELSA